MQGHHHSLVAAACALWAGAGCATGMVVPRDGTGGDGTGGDGTGGSAIDGTGGNGTGGAIIVAGTGGRSGVGGGVTGAGGAGAGGAGAGGIGGRAGTGGAAVDAGVDGGSTTLLSDDFESAGVDARWITDPTLGGSCGDWAVLADGSTHVYQEQASCSSNPSWAAGGDTRWTDMTAQVKVKLVTASSSTRIVVAARFQDEKNYYFLEYTTDGKLKLRYKVAGSSSDVATNASSARVPVMTGAWNTIGLSVSGPSSASTVSALLNGSVVLSGTASGLAAGGVAMGAEAAIAAFDDVVVTSP